MSEYYLVVLQRLPTGSQQYIMERAAGEEMTSKIGVVNLNVDLNHMSMAIMW